MVMESELGLPNELADQIRSEAKTFVEYVEEVEENNAEDETVASNDIEPNIVPDNEHVTKRVEEWQSMTDDLEWVLKCVDENTELCSRCDSNPVSPVLKICKDARQAI